MTPTRIALNPLAARNAASSSPNPSADGSYGGTLYTWLSPCSTTTRPSESVIQRPAWPSGMVGPAAAARAAGGATTEEASVVSAAISRPAANSGPARIRIVPPNRGLNRNSRNHFGNCAG